MNLERIKDMTQQTNLELKQFSGFRDLTDEELQDINGGGALVIIGGVLLVAFVLGAFNGCTDARKK